MPRWVLVVLAVGLAVRPAAADEAADKKRAQELARESQTHYKRGEFEVAIALLRQAYALYAEPNLQYNLGRALESLGDPKSAIEAYETYLSTGKNIDDRPAIERRIATLKAQVEKADHDKAEPVAPVEPVQPKRVEPLPSTFVLPREEPAQPDDHDDSPSALPWVPIGIGALAIGGGAYLGHLASDKHDRAVAAPVGTDAETLQHDAHTFATTANVAFIAGGVVLGAGVVWEIVERTRSHHSTGVGMRARFSPTSVVLEWSLP